MIPRVFHRIWVGGPMPSHLARYGETWVEQHPHWEHVLWNEDNLPPLHNQDLFDDAEAIAPRHVGQLRSDIARYEILHLHGGIYVDTDFEALRSIEPLLDGVDVFTAWEVQDVWANNAILGATPGHPFLTDLIGGLPASVAANPGKRPNRISGPRYLTPILARHPEVTVFDEHLVYPYGFDELHRQDEVFPDAYAVHHWDNKRKERAR